MNIYFKQSIGCVYKNLRSDDDYEVYTYYSKGTTLVDDSEFCTHDQISQGYLIEFVIFAILVSFIIGITERNVRNRPTAAGLAFMSVFITAALMIIVNITTVFAPVVGAVAALFSVMTGLVWLGNNITNPLQLWRDYQYEKEQTAQLRLKQAQDEIIRLRASDPNLNEALKSLDTITTALLD